jgi:hypothetical protein
MNALFLLLALCPQNAPQPERRPNPIVDGVALQAGDALVTLSELERVMKRVQEKQPPANRRDEELQRAQVVRELLTARLEEQAGKDLGLDAEQIGRISRANLEAERDKEGLTAYLADLAAQGKDAYAEESDREQEYYRYFWEQRARGRAYIAQRATREQSVRPGELRALFAENREALAPVTVQLRLLVIASEAVGGAEAARASCEEARTRAQAGEDFALLVEERGALLRETRGLTPFLAPKSFRDPALVPFAEGAELDEFSPVLPLTNPKTGASDPELGYQVAELVERRVPPPAEFSDPEVQRKLREAYAAGRERAGLEREQEKLRRESFVWIHPLIAGRPSQPGNATR